MSDTSVKLLCFLFFSVFVFSRFSSILTGGGDGLALPWSLEKLPVKSSAVNCPNTFGQDCRLKGSKKLAHAQTKCLEQSWVTLDCVRGSYIQKQLCIRRANRNFGSDFLLQA